MPPKGATKAAASSVKRESSIEHTSEYGDFIKTLAEYHEKRGSAEYFDPEPKVGTRHLDLHKLYERVVGEGGYDLVSDTKAKPLMWRKIAEEFLGKSPHLAAQAFMVKSAYYKNLVAYEISTHWKQTPPPIEILERTTAKGANVMGRTLDNYQPRGTRDEENLANGHSSDAEEQDKTPKAERMDVDEPESATGRSTRGLRHAPPQRVLFQPDLNPSRQARTASSQMASPSPGIASTNGVHNPSYLGNPTSMTLANYEPKPQYPLTLKPVVTPANNPDYYRLKRKQQQEASASQVAKKTKGLMLPGTGFIGPNIYVRAQLALQSGLPDEEQYALHHLVKISHERGDKYRFDQFAGLAEALINKVLQISNLFYDIDWSISYDEDAIPGKSTYLDGVHGTADVLKKLKARIPLDTDDDVQTIHFRQALGRIAEAGLVIRNMVMLDENAQYISRLPLLRDYFCIVLNLKPHPAVVEIQHYALETAEQLTKYYNLSSDDVLYHSLLAQLESNDRGKIVTSLRAVSRIGHAFIENKRLEEVPVAVVERLGDWMMVDDEELRSACLDFLMQYTSIADNVETLVLDTDIQGLVRQLSALLLFHAKEDVPRQKVQLSKEQQPDAHHTRVPRLARSLVEQLLRYEEPERSSHWLRMCFEDDPNSEMTQIHLWQSYQGTFVQYAATHPHLIAGDFIKNVSNTFSGASAQVAGSNKYVIRGIRPRRIPADFRGRTLVGCHWRTNHNNVHREYSTVFANADGNECGEYFPNGTSILEHIMTAHLNIYPKKRENSAPRDHADPKSSRPPSSGPTGAAFDFAEADKSKRYSCAWGECTHSCPTTNSPSDLALLARHIETHLPDSTSTASWKNRHNTTPDALKPDAQNIAHSWQRTLTDERKEAAGLPRGCAIVLGNIARGVPRLAAGDPSASTTNGVGSKDEDGEDGETEEVEEQEPTGTKALMKTIFDPVKEKLLYAMAHNYVLRHQLNTVLELIAQGGG
ncbi:hypothetical protein MBLNU459_g8464t1 [Dothideomycetes sp. NU459]